MSRLPVYAKDSARFFPGEALPRATGRPVEILKKQYAPEKNKPETNWVYKKIDKPILAQIEAGIGELYRAFAPDLIAKTRAVYQDGKAVGVASKQFADCITLKSYLGPNFGKPGFEAETEKKIDALVEGGLGVVLALSWFFEEDDGHLENYGVVIKEIAGKPFVEKVVRYDFDMSAFGIVGQEEYRGDRDRIATLGRKALPERFEVTEKDLLNFPDIEDTDFGYWLTIYRMLSDYVVPSHACSKEEVNAFKTLKNHKKCRASVFLTFLQLILSPDRCYEEPLAKHIPKSSDALSVIAKRYTKKRDALKNPLQKNERFDDVWKSVFDQGLFDTSFSTAQDMPITPSVITSAFRKMETYLDGMQQRFRSHLEKGDSLTPSYIHFCLKLTERTVLQVSAIFDELSKKKDIAQDKVISAKQLKESLVKAFYGLLANDMADAEKVRSFLRMARKNINTFVTDCGGPSHVPTSFEEFIENINELISQWIVFFSFLGEDVVDASLTSESKFFTFETSSTQFVRITTLDLNEFIDKIVKWLRERDSAGLPLHKETIIRLFKKQYDAVPEETGYLQQVMQVWSFWRQEPQPRVPTLKEQLMEVAQCLEKATTSDALCAAIMGLLMIERSGTEKIKDQFFEDMINQFSTEFSQKEPHKKIEYARFAKYLHAQSGNNLDELHMTSAIRLFRERLMAHSGSQRSKPLLNDVVASPHAS